jgi:hypothetical protein
MAWHDYLAAIFFLIAAIVVAWRAYRAVAGGATAGCASGCGSCGHAEANRRSGNLLTISPPPSESQR